MGNKTHPIGFRLGIQHTWSTKWFSLHNFKKFLIEDIKIRQYLTKKLKRMGLSKVEIERSMRKTKVTLYVSKPGLIIGRGGAGIDALKDELKKLTGTDKIQLSVTEVKKPFLSAKIIAQEIAGQIERRLPEKRILKGTVEKIMEAGAVGTKVAISGRIAGQEIARTIYLAQGSVPLQNLSMDIDFAQDTALTKYGTIGIKVWINRGEKGIGKKKVKDRSMTESRVRKNERAKKTEA